MRNEKSGVLLTAVMVVMFFLFGCNNVNSPRNNNAEGLGEILNTSVMGIKTVYTSKIPVAQTNRSARTAGTDIETLSYIENGINKPFMFTTSTDKQAVLQIKSIKKVNDTFIGIVFDSVCEVQWTDAGGMEIISQQHGYNNQALINLSTGIFYNFNDYSINNLIADENTIFCTDKQSKTLYKIAINNLSSAVPINNGTYNPAGKVKIITNNGKVITSEEYGNGLSYSFDINKQFVPKQVQPVILDTSQSSFAYEHTPLSLQIGRSSPYKTIIDTLGDVYVYYASAFDQAPAKEKYYIAKIGIDNDGNTTLNDSDYNEYSLPFNPSYGMLDYQYTSSDGTVMYLDKAGFFTVKKNTDSGIALEGTVVAIDQSVFTPQSCSFIYHDWLYWITGTTIKRQQLTSGSSSEIFYHDTNIVNPVKAYKFGSNVDTINITVSLAGDSIIFYKYLDAVTVGTYSINLNDNKKTPVLSSQNTAEIKNIVMLDF